MTKKQLIEEFETKFSEGNNPKVIEHIFSVAVEQMKAIEKNIPQKPIDDRYPWCICPNCRGSVYVYHIQEHIQNEKTTYCEHCGQALDWSDSE